MKEAHVLARACHSYIEFITKITKINTEGYKLRDDTSCFGFIPYDTSITLIKNLKKLRKRLYKEKGYYPPPKFIDIGCGIGNIVLLAAGAGYDSAGLEYNLKTYRIAKKICEWCRNVEIIKGDMKNFNRYHEYDVLYYYQPMKTYKEMVKFSIELAKQMKPGAFVIAHGTSEGFKVSKDFYRVGQSVIWRKKLIRNKK